MIKLPKPDIITKSHYELAELLAGSDEQFLVNAYHVILRRAPTEAEATDYLANCGLVDQQLMKLGDLRYGPEGRQNAAVVRHLMRAYGYRRLKAVPLIGRAVGWFYRVLRIGRLEVLIIQTQQRLDKTQQRLDKTELRLNENLQLLAEVEKKIDQQAQASAAYLDQKLNDHTAESDSWRGEMAYAFSTLRNEWKVTLARDSRALESTARLLAEGLVQPAWAPLVLANEQIYVEFEKAMQAQSNEQQHGHWYMPLIRQLYDETSTLKPCLDLGCGRGEFLVELKRHGFPCVGVDLNPARADASRAQGLEVVVADAIAHLRTLDPASVSVVSAFHLLEYLPFEMTLHLIEAAKRVLIQGGLLILETPNPENLIMGACTFWNDPLRLKPLPPALLKHYVVSAGYETVQVARFTRQAVGIDTVTLDEIVQPSVDAPLDYAILARKK
jgi:SAM-dependent methyltransferase